MANRNRVSGGYNSNRRSDYGNDYNRNFGGRGGGGGGADSYGRTSALAGVSPWQGGSAPGVQASTEATLALANNLINNLLQSRQTSVPSLLDLNLRRDYGGYGQGYQGDRSGLNRMGGGGRNMGQGGGRRGPMPLRTSLPPRRSNKQSNDKPKAKKDSTEDGTNAESDATANNAEVKKDGEAGAEEDGKKEVKTPYDGINPNFLVCHICEKKMWDGRSFDNHIKGRAHHMMMDKIRESYKMTADAMRQEQRISEMRRDRRGYPQARKVYCAMCDLYVASEGAHRRSPGHQKLKRYLHPACNTCRKEMPTRIEFEEHRLTPQHMKILQEKYDEMPDAKNEVMQMSSMQEEMALVRPIRSRQRKGQKQQGDEDAANKDKPEEGQEGAAAATEGGEGAAQDGDVKMESEDQPAQQEPVEQGPPLILDYAEGDDLTGMTRENLPRYQPDRELGVSFIQDFTCRHCTLCRKLFDSEETAAVHTRTYKHYQSFLRLLHSKGDFKVKQEASKRELTKEEEAENGADEDGNWKRRKLDDSNADDQENEEFQENANESTQECNNQEDVGINGADNQQMDSVNQEIDELLDATNNDVQMEEPQQVTQEEVQPETPNSKGQQPKASPVQNSPAKTPARGRGRGRARGSTRNRI